MRQLLASLLLLACSAAAAAGYQINSALQLEEQGPQSVLAWCDSAAGVMALTQPQGGQAGLYQWRKDAATGSLTVPTFAPVTLGTPDAGAGQRYQPFSWRTGSGTQRGTIHFSNIEQTADPAYRMDRVAEFSLPSGVQRCRYVKDAVFMGVTNRRTVIIWADGNRATYATRNFSGAPGVYVTGGRALKFGSESGWGYSFAAQGGYTYQVARGDFVARPQMQLLVLKGGQVVQREVFEVYSLSTPRAAW